MYYTNALSCICIVLAHWHYSPQVDMSLYLDALCWFRTNEAAHTPYCCVCKEAANTNFIVFDFTRLGLEHTITWGEHDKHTYDDVQSVFGISWSRIRSLDWVAHTLIKFKSQLKLNWQLKIIWNAHEIDIHLRFNWDLNLIEVCAT